MSHTHTMKFSVVTLLAICISVVSASSLDTRSLNSGCSSLFTKYTFPCPAKYAKAKGKGVNACGCWSNEYLASFYECTKHGKKSATKPAMELLLTSCSSVRPNITMEDIETIYENATSYFTEASKIKNRNDTLTVPITFKQNAIDLAIRTYSAQLYSVYAGKLYGYGSLLALFLSLFFFF